MVPDELAAPDGAELRAVVPDELAAQDVRRSCGPWFLTSLRCWAWRSCGSVLTSLRRRAWLRLPDELAAPGVAGGVTRCWSCG